MRKHIGDIRDKYILPGETAKSALLFLPSEAIYAELHANFGGIVDEFYRARVWIVSPTTMMATLNTVRAVLKDVEMREQAGEIQKLVGLMMGDTRRLQERVDNLKKHFAMTEKDFRDIDTSSHTDHASRRAHPERRAGRSARRAAEALGTPGPAAGLRHRAAAPEG